MVQTKANGEEIKAQTKEGNSSEFTIPLLV
jgi:hypothetical protein